MVLVPFFTRVAEYPLVQWRNQHFCPLSSRKAADDRRIGQEDKGLIKIGQTTRHRWKIAFFCEVKKILSKTLLRTKKTYWLFLGCQMAIYTHFSDSPPQAKIFLSFFGGQNCSNIHIFQTAHCRRKKHLRFLGGNMVQYIHIFHTPLSFVRFFVLSPIFLSHSLSNFSLSDPWSFVLSVDLTDQKSDIYHLSKFEKNHAVVWIHVIKFNQ